MVINQDDDERACILRDTDFHILCTVVILDPFYVILLLVLHILI